MKTIRLLVDGHEIKVDPTCSFGGLFPRISTPVRLDFTFSREWKSRVKVVAFWSMMGQEYPPRVLEDGRSCIVPFEALQRSAFRVQILGKRNGEKTSTAKCTINLKGARA